MSKARFIELLKRTDKRKFNLIHFAILRAKDNSRSKVDVAFYESLLQSIESLEWQEKVGGRKE